METLAILRAGFYPGFQQLRSVILDCIWRSLWSVLSFFTTLVFGSVVMAQAGTFLSEGPDLGTADPIMVFAALQQFWNRFGTMLLATSGFLILVIISFWLILEALFRGGVREFWVYLGTGTARTALLMGTVSLFLLLGALDEGRGTLFIGAVVILGVWHITGVLETVVRKDALDLLATDFMKLSVVMGSLRLAEAIIGFILFGSAATALLQAGDTALAILWCGLVILVWAVIQSYLVAVRYSTIDIMRENVFRG